MVPFPLSLQKPALVRISLSRSFTKLFSWVFLHPLGNVLCFILHFIPFSQTPRLPALWFSSSFVRAYPDNNITENETL